MIDPSPAIGAAWDDGRAWIPGWSLPYGIITFTRTPGPDLHHAAPNPIQPPCPHQVSLARHPRCNVPRLGQPCGVPPAGYSWRPREGSFCPLGSAARARWRKDRLAHAGVIVVELVLVDRLGGPPVEGYPWDMKTGLRLVRTPGFGGMPLSQWRLG